MSKEMREYKKMHRKHRKEMMRLAKNDAEWDWDFLHNIVITKVKHMYEYYSAGNNVWQCDESLQETLNSLKHVLDLQNELDTLFDDNTTMGLAKRIDEWTNELTMSDEELAEVRKKYDREAEIYREMYKYIGEHITLWWDQEDIDE